MIHSTTKDHVAVEETKEGLCVRLTDYGDANFLEDRLTEDFDVSPIWRREEKKEGGSAEVFFLFFPEAKSRAELQAVIDRIK